MTSYGVLGWNHVLWEFWRHYLIVFSFLVAVEESYAVIILIFCLYPFLFFWKLLEHSYIFSVKEFHHDMLSPVSVCIYPSEHLGKFFGISSLVISSPFSLFLTGISILWMWHGPLNFILFLSDFSSFYPFAQLIKTGYILFQSIYWVFHSTILFLIYQLLFVLQVFFFPH